MHTLIQICFCGREMLSQSSAADDGLPECKNTESERLSRQNMAAKQGDAILTSILVSDLIISGSTLFALQSNGQDFVANATRREFAMVAALKI